MLAQGLARRMFKVSKTNRQQPQTPKQDKRQLKRRKQWQAMQPPPVVYPLPEVLPWKVMG